MSNPLLRLVDLAALARVWPAQSDCLLVVDNTFATPVLVRPLELGADLVMESLTKMIGGHSDVTLGMVCGQGDLLPQVSQVVSIWGLASNPFDCWLAERGLGHLAAAHAGGVGQRRRAGRLAGEPAGREPGHLPGPARPPRPRAGRSRLLDGGFGNMLCFELAGGREAVNRFLHRATGHPVQPSLGHTTTTCSHPGDHLAPLRQPGGEETAGNQRRA